MKIAAKRIRACVGALSAALMSAACVAEHSSPTPVPATAKKTQRGTAPPANSVRYEDLSGAVIEINVPADTWAIVRFDETLVRETNQTFFAIATDPAPGAEPWYGLGDARFHETNPDWNGHTADFVIRGAESKKRIQLQIGYTFDVPFDVLDYEFAFAFGSRFAPTTFYLAGGVPFSVPIAPALETPEEATPVDVLAQRPRVEVNLDTGRGGFGGIYLQSTQFETGEPIEISAGALRVERSPLAPLPENAIQARTLDVSGQETLNQRGRMSYEVFLADQLALHRYDYELLTTGATRTGTGGGVSNIFTPGFRLQVPEEASDPLGINELSVNRALVDHELTAEPGASSFRFTQTLAGREGNEPFPPRDLPLHRGVPVAYLITWGYIPVDFAEAFGWRFPAGSE